MISINTNLIAQQTARILDTAYNQLGNTVMHIAAGDTSIPEASVALATQKNLVQAGVAMLKQSVQMPSLLLPLLDVRA